LLRVRVRIDICHENSEILAASLNPDDQPWAKSRFEDGVVIEVESRVESVISAIDDFMINLKAAVSVLAVLAAISSQEFFQ
jgi:hypothetical protein